MQNISHALQETLQVLYRKAIDADTALEALQREQKGKFQAIFPAQSGFTTQAKRFGPYVEEVANEWTTLQQKDEETIKQQLPPLVQKIEQLLTTINQFQSTLRK
ncbi:hypothetical protein OPS25_12735 [Alteromonas ponticola]|uniref:Prephenate dehydrogenase n=1 Tax=Alteromonas aquimaris TaxID=2998417 RepID=A0ABT3P9E3_9ALTE|nr:hypothetical protein [Alteromonas aquimaris]MCW8109368.1 hypothetical protein [Alteromonas aquimaris]